MERQTKSQPQVNPNKAKLMKELAAVPSATSESLKQRGKDLFARSILLNNAIDIQKKYQLWLYFKSAMTTPGATTKGHDIYGNVFQGPNFATQDYLGLGSSPSAREEATKVIQEFGVHSGGAALAFGTHPWYLDFQREISEFWGFENAIIYSTGWMAGYGIIKGMVRPYDHIIMDRLAHNCLQEGARAATQNVHVIEHLDNNAMIEKIKQVRAADNENAILVVTESLFSMDSDTPDLLNIQKACKKHDAFLLIDMAHDLGAVGQKGLGAVEVQGLTDLSNVILMGSGSKTLGSNIGFVGCHDRRVIEYLRYFSAPYMFSNVVAPPQCAVALHNLRVVRSEEGVKLREKVMNNAVYLREQLTSRGFECIGNASPIVILLVGDELLNRIVAKLMMAKGVVVNGIEFPIVSKGRARLRLQLQAIHTKEHLDTFVSTFVSSYTKAQTIIKEFMETGSLDVVAKL